MGQRSLSNAGRAVGCVQKKGQELSEGVSGGATVAEQGAAQGEHGLRPGTTPLHAGLLPARLDDHFASRLDGASANGTAGLTEFAVAHAPVLMEPVKQANRDS
jgi:hypothetical protein